MSLIQFSALFFAVVFIGTLYNDYHDLKEAKGTKRFPFVCARVVFGRLALCFALYIHYWLLT